MKTTISRILVLAMASVMALSCAACSNDNGASSASSTGEKSSVPQTESTSPEGKTKIVCAIADNIDEIPAIEKMLPDFYEKYPDIEFEWAKMPWETFNDQMLIQLSAGNTGYDLANIESASLGPLVEMGAVAQLDSFADSSESFSWDKYIDMVEENFLMVDGKHYAVPQNPDIRAALYNRPVFEAIGYTDETLPETTDEFMEYVQKAYDAGFIPLGQRFNYYLAPMMDLGSLLMSEGGAFVVKDSDGKWAANLDNEAGRQWIERNRTIAACTPGDNYMTMETTDMTNGFNEGKIGCVMAGIWFTTLLDDNARDNNLVVHKMPAGSAGSKSLVTGNNWIMIEESDQKDAAWCFLEWKNDSEIAAVTTNGLCGMTDNSNYFKEESKEIFKIYQEQFEIGGAATTPAGFGWLNEAAANMQTPFQEAVLTDSLSIEDATASVNAAIQEVIDRNQE